MSGLLGSVSQHHHTFHVLLTEHATVYSKLRQCILVMSSAFVTGNKRSTAGQLEALTETLHEAHMRELDIQERHLRLEEKQLKFQHEQWVRRQSEPVFTRVPRNESNAGFHFVYANEDEDAAEPDLHVMQPARVLKPHEF